ncbi:4-(cytidine 5'-diphospho)-2-C-methyl-D-erythritol kinase [Eggerthella guodeyinii]|nr:4-(cytidine 5'-diphospho)-2-C-methyl-D-erythritol kinase [Eggerthella guodeyinii]
MTLTSDERRAERLANDEHAVDMLEVARRAQGVDIAGFTGPDAVKLVAPAKVNLFLDIGAKRPDGYHDAVSIMHALMLHDVLRMKLAPGRGEGLSLDLACVAREGLAQLDVPVGRNIVAKAVRLLADKLGRANDEMVVACIEKHIPAEAGLGGGSSDAAAALLGAAHLWGVPADDPRIEEAARALGADVAFFLHGGCACFTGVGDVFAHALTPMNTNVVLVKPEGGVSTAAAYRAFDEHPTIIPEASRDAALAATHAADVPLCNNLVPVSEQLLPELVDIRTWAAARADVQRVLMSGSGSAVFVQCPSFADAGRVAADARMRGWWARATTFGPTRAAVVPNR